jgi:hypothetical protein
MAGQKAPCQWPPGAWGSVLAVPLSAAPLMLAGPTSLLDLYSPESGDWAAASRSPSHLPGKWEIQEPAGAAAAGACHIFEGRARSRPRRTIKRANAETTTRPGPGRAREAGRGKVPGNTQAAGSCAPSHSEGAPVQGQAKPSQVQAESTRAFISRPGDCASLYIALPACPEAVQSETPTKLFLKTPCVTLSKPRQRLF